MERSDPIAEVRARQDLDNLLLSAAEYDADYDAHMLSVEEARDAILGHFTVGFCEAFIRPERRIELRGPWEVDPSGRERA